MRGIMIEALHLDQIKQKIGEEFCVSDWLQIDQDRVSQFADCTGDHQWIHEDPEAAKQGPFGGTIAHGFLIVSLISFLATLSQDGFVPEGSTMAVNYGLNKVRLLNPVLVGSKIRDRITLTDVTEKSGNRVLITVTHTVEIEGVEKPACIAEHLTMYMQ
jgi:acyl dehydratase